MILRDIALVVGGVGIGLYLAKSSLETARQQGHSEGYNEGYEEAKERFQNECVLVDCLKRDEGKSEETDEEFLARPEVLEAATKAVDAYEEYSGTKVPAEALVQGLAGAVDRDQFTEEETPARVAVRTAPVSLPEQPKVPVNYNAVSTPTPVYEEKPRPQEDPVHTDVMTQDEFVMSETGFEQFTVTYFHGDDTLAGERDQVITLEERKVQLGDDVTARLKAGPESWGGDGNLFIRNHSEGVELEIIWESGTYAETITTVE